MQPTIIVIDDQPMICRFLANYLQDFSVKTYNNGLQALNHIQAQYNQPHAIIADLNMPGIDGLNFTRELKNSLLHRHIPLFVLSGSQASDDRVKCLQAGADDFITKPFNPEELKIKLLRAIKYPTPKPSV